MKTKTIFALAAIAALVAGMMIPLGAELKTEAKKDTKGGSMWSGRANL
jgi:hypothetical protein